MRNRRYPRYPDDNDYTTNSPSYYDDLARKQKLIEMLAKKIWEYEETLDLTLEEITNRLESYIEENDDLMTDRLEQWDLNLEKFPENVELLLQEWLSDGTLDHIINETIFSWKADKTYVDSEIERLEQKDEDFSVNINEQIDQIFINVKKHGVIGDGVTDDTVAIKNIFENEVVDGSTIYFPIGQYLISDTITVPKNVTVKGNSMNGSIIIWSSTEKSRKPMIFLGRNNEGQNTIFKDIGLNQNRTLRELTDDQSSNALVPSNNTLIERVKIYNTVSGGIASSNGVENITIRDCQIFDTGHHNIYFSTGGSTFIRNITIENNILDKPAEIDDLEFGANIIKFRHDQGNHIIKDIYIKKNIIANGNQTDDNIIINFSTTTGDCYFENIVIENNVLNHRNNQYNKILHGIYMGNGILKNVSINANKINGNRTGLESVKTSHAIRLLNQNNQSESVQIRNNIADNFHTGIEAYGALIENNHITFFHRAVGAAQISTKYINNVFISNSPEITAVYRAMGDFINNHFILTGSQSTAFEISDLEHKTITGNIIEGAFNGIRFINGKTIIENTFENKFINVQNEYVNIDGLEQLNHIERSKTVPFIHINHEKPLNGMNGEVIFDQTSGKPLWWNVDGWYDATGEKIV